MSYTFEDICKANEACNTTPIKGKDYVEVNQRIKAFRSVCPNGAIVTDLVSCENGICIFRATVLDNEGKILGTGTAYEKEGSTMINKTSYIENCETSAVGRALGMCGFGIDTSIASAEEVQTAILNQNKPESRSDGYTEVTPICSRCTAPISEREHDYSVRVWGRPLCRDCQKDVPRK